MFKLKNRSLKPRMPYRHLTLQPSEFRPQARARAPLGTLVERRPQSLPNGGMVSFRALCLQVPRSSFNRYARPAQYKNNLIITRDIIKTLYRSFEMFYIPAKKRCNASHSRLIPIDDFVTQSSEDQARAGSRATDPVLPDEVTLNAQFWPE